MLFSTKCEVILEFMANFQLPKPIQRVKGFQFILLLFVQCNRSPRLSQQNGILWLFYNLKMVTKNVTTSNYNTNHIRCDDYKCLLYHLMSCNKSKCKEPLFLLRFKMSAFVNCSRQNIQKVFSVLNFSSLFVMMTFVQVFS